MTVAELIEQLKEMNQDAEVHFAYGSGDHWRTVVTEEVRSADIGYVKYSDYHRKSKMITEHDDIYLDDGSRDEDVKEVIILE